MSLPHHRSMALIMAFLLCSLFCISPAFSEERVPPPAASPMVLIDASQSLGPAVSIMKFLGIQGPPNTFDRKNPNPWGIEAWRNLSLCVADIPLFDEVEAPGSNLTQTLVGIHAKRTAAKTIDLDFNDFDSQIRFLKNTLGQTSFRFALHSMPKALSSMPDAPDGEHSLYAPKDFSEWYGLVYWSVSHIKETLGIAGAAYTVWMEPETYDNWRGKPGRKAGDLALLDDYIELYAWACKAVKAADPEARVGGPMTVSPSSKINRSLGLTWGMDDFLKKLSTQGTALDDVLWQHHGWSDNQSLSDAARHVQALLDQYGFSSTTRQVLVGWNPRDNESLAWRASFLASNILREVAPTGNRLIDSAYWWPFDYDWGNPHQALVTIPYPALSYAGQGGFAEAFQNPAVTQYGKRPAYAVLQMLHAMHWGTFIRATPDVRLNWEVLAARNGNSSIMAMLANHTNRGGSACLIVRNIAFDSKNLLIRIQRVDATHSADGNGLENGTQEVKARDGETITLTVTMPGFSVAFITLEPAP